MKRVDDFWEELARNGQEVFELTSDAAVPSAHIYPEAPVLSPDGTKLILHRHADEHTGNYQNPLHRYELCDLADGGALRPISDEARAAAPCMSPCGRWVYYFVDETPHHPGRILLRRLELATWERTTVAVLDGRIPGHRVEACAPLYGLATIRRDGTKLAIGTRLSGSPKDYPETGLLIFDVCDGSVEMILHGPSYYNMHLQYCRSPEHLGDLLIQENHGAVFDASGKCVHLVTAPGCDIHVLRDDGMDLRTMAWGRLESEDCRGHQCWRGNTPYALGAATVLSGPQTGDVRLLEGLPVRSSDHLGAATPGGTSRNLTEGLIGPRIDHFATDEAGSRLISDGLFEDGWKIQLSELDAPLEGGLRNLTTLVRLGPSKVHPHPFLSPDGGTAFFNSDITGTLQAYMIRNLPALAARS
mgnify:FL=1|jgi:WD40-like Beta Propeller Repeat.